MRPTRRLLVPVALVAAWTSIVRPRLVDWGATAAETTAAYAGDELVTPRLTRSTFATTLNASPARVWPWLVQMGCDRGGFYSW
ncbi:MAG: hypothetical protein JWQ48_1708, partial [Conexibacter sp.]|nr:hypothetical protein [Conexibacter sp.]